jgi:FkbM family methyltransferase
MNKYYGQIFNGIPVDKFLHDNYFKDKRDGFFIECGAADGFNLSCCKFFEETMGWQGINVEASPTKFKKLVENRPNSFLNLNKGLLNEPGSFIFRDDNVEDPTKAPGWGNGSFQHMENHFYQLHNMGVQLQESVVEVITFKQLIEENNIKHVDLFILDVEGVEPMILESMKECDVLPTHLFIEHEHIGLELCKELTSQMGYRLDWNDFCNSMYIR